MVSISIGSVNVNVRSNTESLLSYLYNQYSRYLSNEEPDVDLVLDYEPEMIVSSNFQSYTPLLKADFCDGHYLLETNSFHGVIDPTYRSARLTLRSSVSLPDIEYFIRILLSFGLFLKGGFLLHSSGIVHNGKAYIFFGKSGAGKSTVAWIMREKLILSDDLVAILPLPQTILAYSTPFWNPGWDQHPPQHVELAGFFQLFQSKRLHLERINTAAAVAALIANIPILPQEPTLCTALFDIVNTVIARVETYNLYFTPDREFWKILPGTGMSD
jgi:hypothetical protein